jgi:hypothetical protein
MGKGGPETNPDVTLIYQHGYPLTTSEEDAFADSRADLEENYPDKYVIGNPTTLRDEAHTEAGEFLTVFYCGDVE